MMGGYGALPRLLQFIEGTSIFNTINFAVPYNSSTLANTTSFTSIVNSFLCPSAVRSNSAGREGTGSTDTDAAAVATAGGYSVTDYCPTSITDIDPNGGNASAASFPATPFRNLSSGANGMLKNSRTSIAEVTDGTSNTIAIAEDAGRDARYLAAYLDNGYTLSLGWTTTYSGLASDTGKPRRFWRWADPANAMTVSGQINNKVRPMFGGTFGATVASASSSPVMDSGANDEIFSYHPGGANCLFGDGSVKFLKDSTAVVVLRKLVTINGGEVVSSDQY